jgi:hypothetical protein
MTAVCVKGSLRIRVEGISSLKEKRSIVSRTKNVLTRMYQISIIESHDQNALVYIGLSLSYISHNRSEAQQRWDKILSELEKQTGGWLETEESQMF